MAVLVEGISVIVKVDAIETTYPGGWAAYRDDCPNATLCSDNELARIGFMGPDDVKHFIDKLERMGLRHLVDGKAKDIVVVDQMVGPCSPCDWVEWGHLGIDKDLHTVAACRLKQSEETKVFLPEGWRYEESLTAQFHFIPGEKLDSQLKLIGTKGNVQEYYDPLTGKRLFRGKAIQ